jgi:hypothetical protein
MARSCEQAAAIGLPAIAFTEHLEFTASAPGDAIVEVATDHRWWSRIRPLDVTGYMATIDDCRQRFPGLRILAGVEAGEPHLFAASAGAIVRGHDFERVLGSLHAVPYKGKLVAADVLFGDTVAVFWTCANAYNLNDWLKPVKVSRHPVAGLGPRLVYAPHAPMRMPGVLYSQQTAAGPWGVWFAAPWMSAGSPASEKTEEVEVKPNPAAGPVRLGASVTRPGRYSLAVFDAAGRLVIDLFRGRLEPGPQSWTWDRTSSTHARVPAGTYFVRLVGPGVCAGRRLVLL